MKIFLDMVGCRLNQSEIEAMADSFREQGHRLVAGAREADLAIINTCAVTAEAGSDSRQKVRQAAGAGANQVWVTGCWATLHPQEASALPGVSRVVPNSEKDNLPTLVFGPSNASVPELARIHQPIPGDRWRTRAAIKVQDGCDNHCTFCATRLARGSSRSVPIPDVVSRVRAAIAGGAKEVVLTGVSLSSWGEDLTPPLKIADLVEAILAKTGVTRLRLSSLEPWNLDARFFSLWQDRRLCRHLHLPLQSGSGATLRRMARRTGPEAYRQLVETAREAIPGLAITTDVIVGFPGESEQEFEESLAFVRSMDFAGGHVFTYSENALTPSAKLPDSVPYPLRKERNARMREELDKSAARYQRRFLGLQVPVLWEKQFPLDDGSYLVEGHTDNYLRVSALSPVPLRGAFSSVILEEAGRNTVEGRLV